MSCFGAPGSPSGPADPRSATHVVVVVLVTAVIFFFWPHNQQQASEVVAGTIDEVQSHQVVYLAEDEVFVVATDEEFLALSDDARHVGDRVLYCALDETFSSSAHGERFDRLGCYVAGPAAGDLGRYPVTVRGNGVLVDVSGELVLPNRSPTSDAPAGPRCQGLKIPLVSTRTKLRRRCSPTRRVGPVTPTSSDPLKCRPRQQDEQTPASSAPR